VRGTGWRQTENNNSVEMKWQAVVVELCDLLPKTFTDKKFKTQFPVVTAPLEFGDNACG